MGDVDATTTKRKRSTSSDGDSSCWQLGIKSTADKWNHIFENQLYSDTRLLVGENVEPVPVDCHKIVLIINSPVFESMLSTRWSTNAATTPLGTTGTGTKEELRLPSDDPCLIKLLVSCFYNGNPVTVVETLDLLLLAKKYICPKVTNKCVQFLKSSINAKNVIPIFQTAYLADEPELLKQAETCILSKACHLVRLQEFSKFNLEHLKYFVGRDYLNVDEVDLFNAVYKWGQLECERRNLDSTKCENISEVLKDIFPLIRFHCMDPEEFSVYVVSKNVLPLEQTVEVYKFYTTPPAKLNKEKAGDPRKEASKEEPPSKLHLQFTNTKARSRNVFSYIFKRLDEYRLSDYSVYDYGERWNNLCFKADQGIKVVSLGLFVPNSSDKEIVVKVRILDEDLNQIFSELEEKITCPNIEEEDIFYVSFPKPVRISKDVFYTISYKIQGQETYFQLMEPLKAEFGCSTHLKINFWFKEAKEASDMDQVPEICFQL